LQLTVDLHSHSGYSGGVGQVSLAGVAETMRKKGIDVFGTGDCLQPEWLAHLEKSLVEREAGLFALQDPPESNPGARFLLQSEIIITADVPSGGRKGVHTVLLFPSFAVAREAAAYLAKCEVKLNMGRPFLKCQDSADVAEKLCAICKIDASIMVIPAHVLTPQGIYGSDHPIAYLSDFYGDYNDQIRVVETGLSADPQVLALIPELDNRTLISNSDCHSPALNRVGREFTVLEVTQVSYEEIVTALYNRKIIHTGEFSPAEGRYFLTGHRSGKNGHTSEQFCYFSPDTAPVDGVCPICGKGLTIGVLQRALELSAIQGEPRTLQNVQPRQKAIYMVPLTEVIAAGLGVKNSSSNKVTQYFEAVINSFESEANLWIHAENEIEKQLAATVPNKVLAAILSIKRGDYTFDPLGYDGEYGELILDRKTPWFGNKIVKI
jgi:PHP family Zn ribbon phosphoesterase